MTKFTLYGGALFKYETFYKPKKAFCGVLSPSSAFLWAVYGEKVCPLVGIAMPIRNQIFENSLIYVKFDYSQFITVTEFSQHM